jgi:nucleotide-binding universal stress UspA family protein
MHIKKILIGVDNSKFAEHAAKYGFEIARSFNAAVGLVHIVEPMLIPYNTNVGDPILGTANPEIGVAEVDMIHIQNEQSENIIADTIKKFAGDLKVTHFTEYGNTADGIINCSKEFKADIVVIGTHSRTGLDRLLMGSIAEHVVRHSEMPVLVVPLIDHNS